MVRRIASNMGFKNVMNLQAACKTGLPDNSVGAVLLYETFHDLSDPSSVVKKIKSNIKVRWHAVLQ
jgi:Methyltransferase domain